MVLVCPVCDSGKICFLEKTLHGTLFCCKNCSHVFTVLNEGEKEYAGSYFDEHSNWFNCPNYGYYNFVSSYITIALCRGDFSLLDVGCGSGTFLNFVKKQYPKAGLFGIDLIENKIEGIDFVVGDFLSHAFNQRFDVVSSIASVEHTGRPREFVEKANRLLEENGLFVVMTIDNDCLIYSVARFLKRLGFSVPFERVYEKHHLQHYTKGSLACLVKRFGFEIVWHKNHGWSTFDVPKGGFVSVFFYRLSVGFLSLLAEAFGRQMFQTILCKKTAVVLE